jgi:hypothetical protein
MGATNCLQKDGGLKRTLPMRFDSYITPSQQLHNNPSHEGGSQCVESIFMCGVVVQLLYWCCKSNIFPTKKQEKIKRERKGWGEGKKVSHPVRGSHKGGGDGH